jgi:hypothetical protein
MTKLGPPLLVASTDTESRFSHIVENILSRLFQAADKAENVISSSTLSLAVGSPTLFCENSSKSNLQQKSEQLANRLKDQVFL